MPKKTTTALSEVNAVSKPNTSLSTQEIDENLAGLNLAEIGLKGEDLKQVIAVYRDSSNLDTMGLAVFGKNLGSTSNQYTDELLSLVKNKDLDETGLKLTKVVEIAQSVNASNLLSKPQGVVGKVLSFVFGIKQGWDAKFDSTKDRIDSLISEVESTQSNLTKRLITMQQMSVNVQQEYKDLGVYIAAGQLKEAAVQKEIAYVASLEQTPEISQHLYDLNSFSNALEKRISDMRILQHSTLQTIPMIRIIQENNKMIIDKISFIKEITIPSWKKQISMALSLHEQKGALEMVNSIDNATNEIIKSNADLMKANSISAAKANQRSIIDVETLQFVQDRLIETVQEVIEIQKDGKRQREEAISQLVDLKDQMSKIVLEDATSKTELKLT